jgi:hypothetical protein
VLAVLLVPVGTKKSVGTILEGQRTLSVKDYGVNLRLAKDQKCGQARVFIVAVSCVSGAAAYLAL